MTDIEILIAVPWFLAAAGIVVGICVARIARRRHGLPRAWMVRR